MRITSMSRINLRRFEFDYDATWTAFFTDSHLNVYTRYGGRDQGDPEARLSKASLMRTMQNVIEINSLVKAARAIGVDVAPETKPLVSDLLRAVENLPKQPRLQNNDLANSTPVFHPIPKETAKPEDLPLLKKSHHGCVHCHQVREYSLLQAYHDGKFRRELLFPFPLPETVGIEIDRQHGHRIGTVTPDSTAAASGLAAGDEILQIDDAAIRSELDLRWALHRVPDNVSQIALRISRPQPSNSPAADNNVPRLLTIRLDLPAKWRDSELSWRKSSRSIPIDWGFRAAALAKSQRREANLPSDGLAVRILSVKPRGLSAAVGLQKGDVILSLDGNRRERTLEQLRSDMLRRYSPGDEVRLTIRRGEEVQTLSGLFPNWFTEETSVP